MYKCVEYLTAVKWSQGKPPLPPKHPSRVSDETQSLYPETKLFETFKWNLMRRGGRPVKVDFKRYCSFWWLVRVTLMVDLVFLPQNFGLVVGTYQCHLQLCQCRWGGTCICWWWGHLNTTLCNRTYLNFLSPSMDGTQKPSLHYPRTPLHILTHPSTLYTPLHAFSSLAPLTHSHPCTPHIVCNYVQGCVRLCKGWEDVLGCARGTRMCKGMLGV